MSYITTYTGKHFDPIQPEPGLFDLTDISHALSLLCRGNGHMKHFYSGTGFERRRTRTDF